MQFYKIVQFWSLKTDIDKYTYRYRYIFFIKTMYVIFVVVFILFFPEVNNIKVLEMEYVEIENKYFCQSF